MSEYWYPFFPSEYKKATRHLTAEQDGIYRRLIDEYMETREPLPDDDIALARIAGVNENKWLDAKRIVIAFFTHTNGTISHEFCDQQLDIQDKRAKIRSESAEKAAKKRWNKVKQIQQLKCDTHNKRNATPMRRNATDTDTSTDTDKKKERVLSDFDEIALAIKLWNDLCKKIGTIQCQKLTAARKAATRARLKDCAGIEGWKSMLVIVENNPFFHGGNDRGWRANIDFVLKEGKFAKIMEGSYNHQKQKGNENAKSKLARETAELLDEIRSRPDS